MDYDSNYIGVVSFRAECETDVDNVLEVLDSKKIKYKKQINPNFLENNNHKIKLPDVSVQIELKDMSIGEFYESIKNLIDVHVIVQTLRSCELKYNDLTRVRPFTADMYDGLWIKPEELALMQKDQLEQGIKTSGEIKKMKI